MWWWCWSIESIYSEMGSQAPWPVRKGIFRSSGQSDFVPTRSPSPIIEMPMSPTTPQPPQLPANRHPLSPRVSIVESPLSPPVYGVGSGSAGLATPLSPLSPTSYVSSTSSRHSASPPPFNRAIREIPIEVQKEVITFFFVFSCLNRNTDPDVLY